jgi:hypothetical protein
LDVCFAGVLQAPLEGIASEGIQAGIQPHAGGFCRQSERKALCSHGVCELLEPSCLGVSRDEGS